MEAPGEKLLRKLWDSLIDKGIGSLLKPWQLRREGRATIDIRREEMLTIAQAKLEVAAIRKGEKAFAANRKLIALPSHEVDRQSLQAIEYVEAIADRNARVDAVRREITLAKTILHAEEELQSDPSPPSPDPVTDDWLFRWRDYASGVCSDELQSLWGKVLAGEIKSPGRYSLRTLEFLRNLSQAEAKAIERISPFVVSGVIYQPPDSLLENEGVNFGELLAMQELGVLAGVGSFGLQMSWPSSNTVTFEKVLTCHGKLLLIKNPDPTKTVNLSVCTVTAIGKQVLQLGTFKPNDKMLNAMGVAIKALGFEVEIGNYLTVSDSQLNAFDLVAL